MSLDRVSSQMAKAFGAFVLAIGTLSAFADSAQASSDRSCTELTNLASAELKLTDAHVVKADAKPSSSALPAYCLVRGTINPRTGADGKPYGIGFEMRMPTEIWNGDLLFEGGGGLDGLIHPAVGQVASDGKSALARGFAVIASDGGHEGGDGSFAADQQSRLDFAYAEIGTVGALGKSLIERFYGSSAKYSYFMGCSNGGREAMMAAQRFPLMFDGIVAGDPGFNLTHAAIAELWRLREFLKIAPKTKDGQPILSEALTDDDLKVVSDGVLAACDDLDGLHDGIINNLGACHFSLKTVTCKPKQTAKCLTPTKAHALEVALQSPIGNGRPLYSSFPYDSGISDFGWRLWTLGMSPTATPNAMDTTLGLMASRQYFVSPADPSLSPLTFDFDRDPERMADTASINDASSTVLSSFIAHGGKLIIYHGNSDPIFSANASIDWYQKLSARYPQADASVRLFLVPGMAHCGGGPATDQFDAIDAIQRWREDQHAPDQIPAHGNAFPNAVRPLCPYPKYARYLSGDPSKITSFACQ